MNQGIRAAARSRAAEREEEPITSGTMGGSSSKWYCKIGNLNLDTMLTVMCFREVLEVIIPINEGLCHIPVYLCLTQWCNIVSGRIDRNTLKLFPMGGGDNKDIVVMASAGMVLYPEAATIPEYSYPAWGTISV